LRTVDELLAAQKSALRENGVIDYRQRRTLLRALAQMLRQHSTALSEAIARDFGRRHPRETEIYEIYPLQAEIAYVLSHLRNWTRPRAVHTRWPFLPARSQITPQPVGVVGIIGAWNYPLLLTLLPLISAIAAGNRAIIKGPRLTPQTMTLLAQYLRDVTSEDTIALVQGSPDVDHTFPGLPFDHLIFSGATRTGRVIARAAARNLVPVTLSMSGKSPAIIQCDYPLATAARSIMAGKLVNAGQTCIAPDYCLVAADQRDDFIALAKSAALSLYPHWADNPDYTSIPNVLLWERLEGLLQDARRKGAILWQPSPAPALADGAQRSFPPTLLWDARPGMKILEEEIFGPILVVLTYDDIQEALDYVRDHPAPLALYYFDRDQRRALRHCKGIAAGGVTINDTIFHVAQPGIPFGGIGLSGIGQYRGMYGFQRLSHYQGVFRQNRLSACEWVRPPYGRWTRLLIAWLSRWG